MLDVGTPETIVARRGLHVAEFAADGESATTWNSIWTLELLQTSRNFGRL